MVAAILQVRESKAQQSKETTSKTGNWVAAVHTRFQNLRVSWRDQRSITIFDSVKNSTASRP